MRRNFSLLMGAAMAVIVLTGCADVTNKKGENEKQWIQGLLGVRIEGSTNYVTKEFNVKDFDELVVKGPMDVNYVQRSGKRAVQVNTSDNLMNLVDVHIKGRTLYLALKPTASISFKRMDIQVIGGPLKKVTLAGSGDFTMREGMRVDGFAFNLIGSSDVEISKLECGHSLNVTIAGSGDVTFHDLKTSEANMAIAGSGSVNGDGLRVSSLSATVSGSGDFCLKGEAGDVSLAIAGSGDIEADQLRADDVDASVSGSGSITCHARKSLNAQVSGSGRIGYSGNPAEVSKSKRVEKL